MVNIVEYEFIIYTFLTIVDIILGTFVHTFVKKDNTSSKAKIGALKKLLVLMFMGFALITYDLDKVITFDPALKAMPLIANIKSGVIAIFGYMCYFEFVSVAANFSLLSGIDLTKIPGVSSEIKEKRDK